MASLFRREYKIKAEDAAIQSESKVQRELAQWQDILPTALEKLSSAIGDIRVAALRTAIYQTTGQYLGEDLEPLVNDFIEQIVPVITENASREEHDAALFVACSFCIQLLGEFESYAMTLLNEFMPTLADVDADCALIFFALAFLTAFGVNTEETCIRVLKRFIQLVMNKKTRGVEFSPVMIMEAVDGITLMLAAFPASACISNLSEIEALIDRCMDSQKGKVIISALDLLLVVWDCMQEYENEIEDESEGRQFMADTKRFLGKYNGKMEQLPRQVAKKAQQRVVRERCEEIQEVMSGSKPCQLEATFNDQSITIEGARKLCLVNALKRVLQHHFAQQMSDNVRIHELIGYQLLSKRHALRVKKEMKDEIKSNRDTNKKQRQMDRSKKRRQKQAKDDHGSFAGETSD